MASEFERPDLSNVPDETLIQEVARRLLSRRQLLINNEPTAFQEQPGVAFDLPTKNAARLQMAQALRRGSQRGQASEILRFLISKGNVPQTMGNIALHMKRCGYTSTRFYDASNALVDAGLAELTIVGNDKAWIATVAGREFLNNA